MGTQQVSSLIPEKADAEMARAALVNVRKALGAGLAKVGPHDPVRLRVADEVTEVVVPKAVLDLLVRVLANMAAGQGVTVVPSHAELTTQQAADILNVSRPFLVNLLEAGHIEFRTVGTHRRVKVDSLLGYMRQDDADRKDAADELSAMTQADGFA